MIGRDKIACAYIDYTHVSKEAMTNLFNQHASTHIKLSPNEARLYTCQRAEIYRVDGVPRLDEFTKVVDHVNISQGYKDVLERMLTIASGLNSWFLGEKYIASQLVRSFEATTTNPELLQLSQLAYKYGRSIRDDTGLVAKADYPDVALELLSERANLDNDCAIIIFGGGMLGLSSADTFAADGFQDIKLVTRNPKKLRKKAVSNHQSLKLMNLRDELKSKKFVAVLATLNITPQYASEINSFLDTSNCIGIAELSALPLQRTIRRDVPYFHMYGDEFAEKIATYNEMISHIVPKAQKAIKKTIKTLGK
jgi:glutamyl-tRNA reductase